MRNMAFFLPSGCRTSRVGRQRLRRRSRETAKSCFAFKTGPNGQTDATDGQTKDERAAVSWIRRRQDKTIKLTPALCNEYPMENVAGFAERRQEEEVLRRGHGMQDSIFRPLRSRMIHLQMAHETSQVLLQLKETFHIENIRPTLRTKFWRLFPLFLFFLARSHSLRRQRRQRRNPLH